MGLALLPLISSTPPRITLVELFQVLISRKGRFFLLGVGWGISLSLFLSKTAEGSVACPVILKGSLSQGTNTVKDRLDYMISFPLQDWLSASGETELGHLVSQVFVNTHHTDNYSTDSHQVALRQSTYLIIRILVLIISAHIQCSYSVQIFLLKLDTYLPHSFYLFELLRCVFLLSLYFKWVLYDWNSSPSCSKYL